jgi:outer membrane lipoprotein-sorting protein
MRLSVLLITMLAAAAVSPAADNSLQEALAKIDQAAAGFKGMTADITKVAHLDVISENTTEKGTIKVKKVKPHDIRILVDIREPDPKQYAISGNKALIYYPKRNEVEEWEVSRQQRALGDQLMLVGFGNAADLNASYSVQYGGAETVAGQKAIRLDLTPKSQELLQHFPKVQLWISSDTGLPVQQKFYQKGSKDFNLVTYTNVAPAPNLSEADVKLNVPKGAKVVRPQR